MQALSDKQIAEVTQTILDHHLAFIVQIAGVDAIPAADLARLKRKGLIAKNALSLPETAFAFGLLQQGIEAADEAGLSYQAFLTQMATKPVELTFEEKAAVKALRRNLANRVKGLGNTLDQKTQQVLIEADHGQRRRMEHRIRSALVTGIEQRKTVAAVAGELAKLTGDMQRDWHRVAATEIHNAFLEGRVAAIQKRNKGTDPLVFKRCRPDACAKCKEHYLEKDGVTPTVFHLSQLIAHGTTNEGRKVHQWRPVLGCMHPYCQCTLHELPAGFAFGPGGQMVYRGVGT